MPDETTPSRAPDDLVLLDELLRSEGLWVERAKEASALADHILHSSASIVVLHGPSRSGKSELIHRWLMPSLRENRPVFYRSAWEPAKGVVDIDGQPVTLSDALGAQGIVILDEFEQDLARDGGTGGEVVEQLARWAAGEGRGGQVVLVLHEDHLSDVFQLRGKVPGIVDDVHEMPRFASTGLGQVLARTTDRFGIHLSGGFLDAVARDLTAMSGPTTLSPELVAVLTFQLRRSTRAGKEHELVEEDYQALGGVIGILESHLDFLCEHLPNKAEPPIAWAVLEEAVNTGQQINLDDIANRFDVEPEAVAEVLRWLETDRRLLVKKHHDRYDIVPGQLLTAVSVRAGREADAVEYPMLILRQGVRHFAEVQALLSDHAFRRVHAHRSSLTVTDAEAGLMLRCALAYADPHVTGVTEHWSRRVKDPGTRLGILLDALSDSQAIVRQGAAVRLREFPLAEVRSQLHLLALRDSSDSVRTAAIASLDAVQDFKTDGLREALIQEVNERSSPYRLQAIEALRIFPDVNAVATLVRVIASTTPADAREARARAISALGDQETPLAADALVDIALHDEDIDDRNGAAHALGLLRTEGTIRHVLNGLRQQQSPATTAVGTPPAPVKATLRTLVGLATALAVVGASVFIHGLLLVTLRRFILAVAVTTLEVLGIIAYLSEPDRAAGLILMLLSLAFGLLIPLRTVLVERRESKPQGSYRRGLGVVLFAFSAVSFFLYLHGLGCLLVKQVRRGWTLIGFEGIGLVLWIGGGHFVAEEFGAFAQLPSALSWVSSSFAIIGLVILATTYVTGVVSVLLDVFVLRQRRRSSRRIAVVHAQMARNPRTTAIVLEAVGSRTSVDVRWGSRMVRKFAPEMQHALRAAWNASDRRTQRRIFSALAWNHDRESLEFLKAESRALGWPRRLHYAWANVAFRLSPVPRPLLLLVAVLVYVQVGIGTAFYTKMVNEPERLARQVKNRDLSEEKRHLAVRNLQLLAEQKVDRGVASRAATGLVEAFAANPVDDVRDDLLAAIAIVARGFEIDKNPVDAVAELLDVPETRLIAIDALEQIATGDAVARLKEFVLLSAAASRSVRGENRDAERDAKKRAIEAIGNMSGVGVEALRSLISLHDDNGLLVELREAAGAKARSFDALTRSEYDLAEDRLDDAIREADQALTENQGSSDRQLRASHVLSKAYGARAARAFDRRDYKAAQSDLLAGLSSAPREDSLHVLVLLGLNLAFVTHEELAPADRKKYQDVYVIVSKLDAMPSDAEDRRMVRLNLAESSLTTGRYGDALKLAQELANDPQTGAEMTLNMRWMIFAAHALGGNKAESERAGRDLIRDYEALPRGFQNTWSYKGTRNYVSLVAPPSIKDDLLHALDKIEQVK